MNDSIPQASQSPLTSRFYLSDGLHLIRRHWPILFVVPAIIFGGLIFLHLTGTKFYAASASVYMDPSFGNRIQTETTGKNTPALQDDEEALFSMEETICSDTMILRVLKKLELISDPEFLPDSIVKRAKEGLEVSDGRIVDAIRGRYAAELVSATRILKVYVEDPEPERAVLIAKTFISEFVLFLQEQKVQSEMALKENLSKQAEMVKQRAVAAEQNLNQFRNRQSGFLVEQDSNLFTQKMEEAGMELNQTSAELIKLENLMSGLDQIDAKTNPVRILNLSKGEYAVSFDQILAQRSEALSNLKDAEERFGPSHSNYRAAYNQFTSVDELLQSSAQEIKNSTKTRHQLLMQQKATLESEMNLLRTKFNSYKSAGAEFRGLTLVAEREWQLYDRINDRILSLTDQADLSQNLATPLGDPIVPFKPTKKKLITMAAASVLLSSGWVVLLGAILILRGLPFTCPRQIQELLDVPVAGYLTRQDLAKPGILSSLPLLTASSKVIHLTSADSRNDAPAVCQMVTEAYLEQGGEVTVLQISDQPGSAPYRFGGPAIDIYQLSPSQIEVRRLRITIRDFLNENSHRTIVIDTTGVADPETKLALGKITNATVILVPEKSVTREQVRHWIQRFKREAGNILALYQASDFPNHGSRKALPVRPRRPAAENFQLKHT